MPTDSFVLAVAGTLAGPARTALVSLVLVAAAIALAIRFGGPAPVAPLASINAPFAKVDFSDLPQPSHFTARDGARLAWLHYPAITGNAPGHRIVLVHGSSARARSMHVLARALAQAGFVVAALDMRGHSDSVTRGRADYMDQLEHDVADFMRAVPHASGGNTLVGFSSGGGFVLRFAAGAQQDLFDRYLLLAPYLHHAAPTNRSGTSAWVSVGLPRIIGLSLINRLGVTRWNKLPVLRFALDDAARQFLTSSYSYTLARAFQPRDDYQADIRNTRHPLRVVAGTQDALFDARKYAATFAAAGRPVPVTLVDGVDHIGLTLDPRAVPAIVAALRP